MAAQPDAVGRFVAGFDANRLPRLEVVALDEAQEGLVLIDDAGDGHGSVERAGKQALDVLRPERAFRIGNRVAMRIRGRASQHFVDAVDQPVRDHVLQLLRLVVHLVPPEAEHAHEEQLDQPVTADDHGGEFLAGGRQRHARVGLVEHEARLRQRLHHRCRSAWRDVKGGREVPHRQQPLPGGQARAPEVDGLQIVFDRARRKHGDPP